MAPSSALFCLFWLLCANTLAIQQHPEWPALSLETANPWNSSDVLHASKNPMDPILSVLADAAELNEIDVAAEHENRTKVRNKRMPQEIIGQESYRTDLRSSDTDVLSTTKNSFKDFGKWIGKGLNVLGKLNTVYSVGKAIYDEFYPTESPVEHIKEVKSSINDFRSESRQGMRSINTNINQLGQNLRSGQSQILDSVSKNSAMINSNLNRGVNSINSNINNMRQENRQEFAYLNQQHGVSQGMIAQTQQMVSEGIIENRGLHGKTHWKLDQGFAEMREQHGQIRSILNQGITENRGLHGMTHQMLGQGFSENRGLHGQSHSMLDRNLAAMQTGFAMLGRGVDRNYEAIVHGTMQMHQQFACTQFLINQGRVENAQNFETTFKLINQGRVENAINFALTQDFINDGRVENAVNFQNAFYLINKAREENERGFSALSKMSGINFEEILRSRLEARYRFDIINDLVDRNYRSSIEGRREAGAYFNATVDMIGKGRREAGAYFNATVDMIGKGRAENWKYFNATFTALQQIQNESLRQAELARLDRYAYYMSTANLLNATHEELRREFGEVRDDIARLSEQVDQGFNKIAQMIRQSSVDPILSKLVNFIEYFNDERKNIEKLNKDNLLRELKDEHGSFFYLIKMRTPKQSDSLHSLLNDLIVRSFALPKNETDQVGLVALDFLCYGMHVYAEVMQFVLSGYSFLADEAYSTRDLDNYNKYHSKFITTFDEFHTSISGSPTNLIDKTSEILKKVKSYPQMSKKAEQILAAFREVKTNFNEISAKLPRDAPNKLHIKLDFEESQLRTPIGEWSSGKKVSYAMQFVKQDAVSQIGPWSDPYPIDSKAGPQFLMPPVFKSNTTILLFRRFDQRKPELVGILKAESNVQKFHDIDRDLYNAAGTQNNNLALSLITTLIDNGANKWTQFEDGRCSIHAAASILSTDIIKKLVENDTEAINKLDADGNTPLHLAMITEYYDQFIEQTVNQLIELDADVNSANKYRMFPLLIATDKNKSALVEMFLRSSSIDPNQQYERNMTALHFAAQNGQDKITGMLLNHSLTDQNARTFEQLTPLHLATIYGRTNVMKILCSSTKVDVNEKASEMMTALHYAALIGDTALTTILLNECGAIDVNAKAGNGITAIHFASGAGNTGVVQQLLSHKDIDVNAKTTNGWTPLHFAIALRMNETAMKLLLDDSIEISSQTTDTKVTPLQLASLNSIPEVVKRLIQRDAQTNVHDNRNFTALHYGAMFSDDYILKKLIDSDEKIDEIGENGLTPLHVATMHLNLNAVQFLLSRQPPANIDAKTQGGETPLHLGVTMNNASIVEELIRNGAKIDELNEDEKSPLYLALKHESFDVIRILMNNGSKLNVPYSNNKTLIDVAVKNGEELQILKSIEKMNLVDEFGLNALKLASIYKVNNYSSNGLNNNSSNTANLNITDIIHNLLKNFNQKNFDILLTKLGGTKWTNEDNKTLLHIAASNGYYDAAVALIDKDPSLINTTDKNHWFPLHFASWNGHCNIVELLLSRGANVNALSKFSPDSSSATPSVSALYWAARAGHPSCVQMLLIKGASINHQDHNGWTALHEAADDGEFEVVKILVENGANTSIETNVGNTALELAAWKNVSSDLIAYLASRSKNPIHRAVFFKDMKILNGLIAAGVKINMTAGLGRTPLHTAASKGFYNASKTLIDKDLSLINATDDLLWLPLHLASFYGHCDIIELLLSHGANVNALSKFSDDSSSTSPSVSALHWASHNGCAECVQTLLIKGASINHQDHNGWTALHEAADDGEFEVVKILVENGANTSIETNHGVTALELAVLKNMSSDLIAYLASRSKNPIHRAVFFKDMKILNGLIAAGVQINTTNDDSETPLHTAASKGFYNASKTLIDKDPSLINATDKNHWFPLHTASFHGKCNIVELLLSHGANVNALSKFADYNSTTDPSVPALHLAASAGHPSCVRMLLNKGASINHQDHNGWTALHEAAGFGEFEIVKILVEAGANTSIKTNRGIIALELATVSDNKNNNLISYLRRHTKT